MLAQRAKIDVREHEHRQERRPVDDDQDDEHREHGHEQQHAVDAREGAAEVGDLAGRPGDVRLQTLRRTLA